ncbi:hypothetical protein [Pseudomonas phage PMBT14]|uniref:Uncharacterized protein n=1 Tax=Pseudomonas phage PMBT14 TaxID=2059855 RepID=A0A2S1B6J3_9CAUD|nr:hypothetical protein HWB42_gp24 [Pseudomonas phage PMBT14]AWC67977.1 hypothetical protein [Pseudomonas phage PMBT14]
MAMMGLPPETCTVNPQAEPSAVDAVPVPLVLRAKFAYWPSIIRVPEFMFFTLKPNSAISKPHRVSSRYSWQSRK